MKVQINGNRKFRTAKLDIKFSKISIPPPPYKTKDINGDNLINLDVWCIYAKEKKSPMRKYVCKIRLKA